MLESRGREGDLERQAVHINRKQNIFGNKNVISQVVERKWVRMTWNFSYTMCVYIYKYLHVNIYLYILCSKCHIYNIMQLFQNKFNSKNYNTKGTYYKKIIVSTISHFKNTQNQSKKKGKIRRQKTIK